MTLVKTGELGRTESPDSDAARTHRPRLAALGQGFRGAVVAAPDRLVIGLFWVALVAFTATLVGQFRPWTVLPSSVAVIAATLRFAPRALAPSVRNAAGAFAALAIVAAWAAVNLPYASRFVIIMRDPGFLTLAGIWLRTHATPELDYSSAAHLAAQFPGLTTSAPGFGSSPNGLQSQGADLLPSLLAMLGWAGGNTAVAAGNLVLGGLAILAVYGLARRIVGPVWALVPVVALACSMPMTVFSRAAYTEPVAMALVFGGLTVLWSAYHGGRNAEYALGGAMVGAAALARIDGGAAVAGLVAATFLVAGGAVTERQRHTRLVAAVVTSVAAVTLTILGYADLRIHSSGYLSSLGNEYSLLIAALAAAALGGLLVALPQWWAPIRHWTAAHRLALAWTSVAAALVWFAVLVSRPYWLVAHHFTVEQATYNLMATLQAQEGLPIDGSRSYDELALRWLTWYFGWPAIVLAFAGLAVLAWRAVYHRQARPLVAFTTLLAPTVLYLWVVEITPDQIWAMRRFLPETIPALLIAATALLAHIARYRRWRWVAAAAGVVVAVTPVFAWGPMFRVVEQNGRLGENEAVCTAIAGRPTVYVRTGTAGDYLANIRAVCDVQVVTMAEAPTSDQLRAISAAWGGDIAVVSFTGSDLPWSGGAVPAPLRTTTWTQWRPTLSHPPQTYDTFVSYVWVGVVGADGTVTDPSGNSRG